MHDDMKSSAPEIFAPDRPAWSDLSGQWRPGWALAITTVKRSLLHRRVIFMLFVGLIPAFVAFIWRIAVLRNSFRGDEIVIVTGSNVYSVLMGSIQVGFIWPLITLWLGASCVRDEVEEETVSYLMLRPLSKMAFVTAKTLAAAVTSWIVITCSILLTYAILASHIESGMFPSELPLLARDLGVVALASWAYVGIFCFLGSAFKHPYVFGFIWIFIWDGIVAFIPGTLHQLTVKHYVRCLYSHTIEIPIDDRDLEKFAAFLNPALETNIAYAVFVLIAIGVVGTALAVVLARRREYVLEQSTT